jgi:hypothetical protein
MKNLSMFPVGAVGAMLVGSTMTALAGGAPTQSIWRDGTAWADNPAITQVGPVAGTITALNYDADGRTVNGLYIGASNTMLTFERPVSVRSATR